MDITISIDVAQLAEHLIEERELTSYIERTAESAAESLIDDIDSDDIIREGLSSDVDDHFSMDGYASDDDIATLTAELGELRDAVERSESASPSPLSERDALALSDGIASMRRLFSVPAGEHVTLEGDDVTNTPAPVLEVVAPSTLSGQVAELVAYLILIDRRDGSYYTGDRVNMWNYNQELHNAKQFSNADDARAEIVELEERIQTNVLRIHSVDVNGIVSVVTA